MARIDRRLTGRCRYCGAGIAWPKAAGVVFADYSEAHTRCYEREDGERQRRLAERRVARAEAAELALVPRPEFLADPETGGEVEDEVEGGSAAAEVGRRSSGEDAGALFLWAAEGGAECENDAI